MWITKLKIALAQKDVNQIEKLANETLDFDNAKDAKEAMFLLSEAMTLLFRLKDETGESMGQVKKNIDFLKSTEPQKVINLDIKS